MSVSTHLRLVLVVLCIAGLSAAQSTFTTCPSPQSSSTDYFASSNCTAVLGCATTRCTCNGGTYSNSTELCTITNYTGKTCDTATPCQAAYIQCIQAAANEGCLSSLKVALMSIAAGTAYNSSAVDLACRAETCRNFNQTVAANCTIPYSSICFAIPTPTNATTTIAATNASTNASSSTTVAQFVGTLTLDGDFTAILNNATKKQTFINALDTDLTAKFGVTCKVTSIVAGSAVITFTANTAANNATFLAVVSNISSSKDASWLKESKTQFTALGGTGNFGVLGIGASGTTIAPATPTPTKAASSLVYVFSVFVALILAVLA